MNKTADSKFKIQLPNSGISFKSNPLGFCSFPIAYILITVMETCFSSIYPLSSAVSRAVTPICKL